jgi:AraC family transcriptional regulator, regulatory protein of adaptative response / methylated-DNA-[protein]-cysteine methyltransferase
VSLNKTARSARNFRGCTNPGAAEVPLRTSLGARSVPSDPGSAELSVDPRWAAVRSRDSRADGQFLYAVKTTGVYCRPSCASRLARPQNISFYDNAADAERDGFRACLRCKPDAPPLAQRHAECAADLCRWLEQAQSVPTLKELAARAGLSTFHTQRMFKAQTGMTPRQYAAAQRGQRVRAALAGSGTVTQALYEAGYSSSGRFYSAAAGALGMKPSAFKAGGAEQPIRFAVGECSLGSVLVAATARGVCAILLGDEPEALVHDLERRFHRAELIGADADFEAQVAQVIGFIEGPGTAFPLPLDIRGTVFQQRVWQALSAIASGQTQSYSELAQVLGEPKAVRAVASACAANALAIAIPCHRVVRTDGSLSGYRWGVERKRELLARERLSAAERASRVR